MKILYVILFFLAFSSNLNAKDKYQDLLFSEEAMLDNDSLDARFNARDILNTKPVLLEKKSFPKFRKSKKVKKRKADKEILTNAPLGLSWGATYLDTKNLGVGLKKIEMEDSVNAYRAVDLPKPIKDFDVVDVVFGQDNKLWRMLTYSNYFSDNQSAEKIMTMYKIYYDLLNKKYGNAKQFYTPVIINVEFLDKNGKKAFKTKELPIGNDDFLKQLQSGQAELYATFYNNEVGVALAVNVDGQGKSYLSMDYKNLRLLKRREKSTIDAL